MSVVDFYRKVLISTGCDVEENGLVSREFGGNKNPLKISIDRENSLRLTLPTKQFLDSPDWNNLIAFHPLSENIVKGESIIIKELKKLMEFRITDVITTMMLEMTEIAVDKNGHKKLSPTQKKFLTLMPEANEKTFTQLSKILCSISNKGERKLCSLYIKRGGSINGTPYKRVGVVSFPITDELNKEEKDIFDIKLSAAEKKAIKSLFYWLLPNADVVGAYNYGSEDETAPNFHALCGAFMNVMKNINAKMEMFKEREEIGKMYREINWDVEHGNLKDFYGEIPVLPYNDGDVAKTATVQTASLNTQQAVTQVAMPTIPVPMATPMFQQPAQPQAAEVTEDGKLSWNSVSKSNPMLATAMFNPSMPFQTQQQPMPGSYPGYDRGVSTYAGYPMMQQPIPNFSAGRI